MLTTELPRLQKDIDKLEKVQHQAARFILHFKESWLCYTDAIRSPSSTSPRHKVGKLLGIHFKVVEGLVPALQIHDYLTPVRSKHQIKSGQF